MRKWAALVGLVLLAATPWAGCQQNAVTVPVRSLERSGKAAFFCIRNPSLTPPGLELRACSPVSTTLDALDYSIPHTIGLVTQQARGEVAVVDLTAGGVIDVDPTLPGENFLPVGALPTDIVATPGSTAAFVAIGDPIRPGIFALTSANLYLPGQHPTAAPALAGFPACALPAVPSQLLLVADRTGLDAGTPRVNCSGVAPASPAPGAGMPLNGYDLSGESAVFGTQKILALMPDLGQVAVIDAQALLWRGLGTFDACPIERMVSLQAGATGAIAGDAGADGSVCSAPPSLVIPPPPLAPHPAAMAYADDGRLFVSDDRAAVIHVVDLSDVCAPAEQPPLLPTAVLDPTRAVTTTAIAVTPQLSDNTRFVYAVDVKNNGSVMVFDVSAGATQRTPLLRPDVQFNQQEPPDRIAFASPVVSLTFARHELLPTTVMPPPPGVVNRGQQCNPTDPNDPNRPPTDFITLQGAGPHVLRGVFGYLVLSDGRLGIIDVDDLDAPCRRPQTTDDVLLGCKGMPYQVMLPNGSTVTQYVSASQEVSCNVVERHRPRSNQFFTNVTGAGQHAPAMQGFPLLHDKDGTALSIDPTRPESAERPEMLSPRLSADANAQALILSVTGLLPEPPDQTWWTPGNDAVKNALQNSVAFDLREPRGHVAQGWAVTYEGAFAKGTAGRLQCLDANRTPIECESGSQFELFDSSVGFCSAGTQGADLAAAAGMAQGDVVQVTSDFPDPNDPYWSTVTDVCSRQTCELNFGTIDNMLGGYDATTGEAVARDFIVQRAYQDHLVLAPSARRGVPIACCFPYPVAYSVRGGKQWIVTGSVAGFAHHVIPDPSLADPATAACVQSCDPTLALRNGRVLGVDQPADPSQQDQIPTFDDPRTFRNSNMRFVVWNPKVSDCSPPRSGDAGPPAPPQPCVRRDMFFSFQEVGGFDPLLVPLSGTALVLPASITFVPGLEQLAIPDPVSQGLMMFDLNSLRVIQTIF